MPYTDAVEEMRKERKRQKQNALNKLEEFVKSKIFLKRPVFFVPGWTDESCECWKKSDNNICIKDWIAKICSNPEEVRYINFEKETSQCKSFLDFGEVVKNEIWNYIGKDKEFDIVGHSMGGLDIRAAITQNEQLMNTRNCLTVATPHQGDNFGGVDAWLRKIPWVKSLWNTIKKETSYQVEQVKGLDPDYEPIKIINKVDNKTAFLEKIGQLYEFKGTMDFTVKGSAYLSESGIDPELCKRKINKVEIDGADHTGKTGITQDPRAIFAIIKILVGIKLEEIEDLNDNHGIFIGGIQK